MKILHNRLFLKLEEEKDERITSAGIIIQEFRVKDTQDALNRSQIGEILEVGDKIKDKSLKVGRKVHILGRSGASVEIEGTKGVLVRESEVLAIIL